MKTIQTDSKTTDFDKENLEQTLEKMSISRCL